MFTVRFIMNTVSFFSGLLAALVGVQILSQEVLAQGHAATNPVVIGLVLTIGGAILFTGALRDFLDQIDA